MHCQKKNGLWPFRSVVRSPFACSMARFWVSKNHAQWHLLHADTHLHIGFYFRCVYGRKIFPWTAVYFNNLSTQKTREKKHTHTQTKILLHNNWQHIHRIFVQFLFSVCHSCASMLSFLCVAFASLLLSFQNRKLFGNHPDKCFLLIHCTHNHLIRNRLQFHLVFVCSSWSKSTSFIT